MLTAKQIAEYFLAQSESLEDGLSNLKVQKLCYYAQGFYLAAYDSPLFREKVMAWQHGPVVVELYHDYKIYGANNIPFDSGRFDLSVYDEDMRGLLDQIYEVYGQFSAWKLRNMAHEESPWINAWDGITGPKEITHKAMRNFFLTRLED